jgi:hypothetical protein
MSSNSENTSGAPGASPLGAGDDFVSVPMITCAHQFIPAFFAGMNRFRGVQNA